MWGVWQVGRSETERCETKNNKGKKLGIPGADQHLKYKS